MNMLQAKLRLTYNIASGSSIKLREIKLREIILKIAQKMKMSKLIQLGAKLTQPSEPLCILANTDRLTKELNWSPQYSLEKDLEETIGWWKLRTNNPREAHQASIRQPPISKAHLSRK